MELHYFCIVSLHLILAVVGLFVLIRYKKRLNIEKPGHNPLVLIYKVLKYAWKHTFPENRSAFTYWENDIPPRIDLGKNKYGGPFTTEEVEDTKSFFRILFLLFSLLGFHLSGHGYSTVQQLMMSECPNTWLLILIWRPNEPHYNCYLHRYSLVSTDQCSGRNVIFPVSEGTAVFRESVFPCILQHLVDQHEWIMTSSTTDAKCVSKQNYKYTLHYLLN